MTVCPCGSNQELSACCAIIHRAAHKASSAEQLMRARFSAFALGEIDFIIDTYHSSANAHLERDQIANSTQLRWVKLDIIDAPTMQTASLYSYVEFKAWFMENGKLECLHERSRFIKESRGEHSQWCYLDGKHNDQTKQGDKLGRNDPCPCSSGKKYKKCCANS